MLLIAVIPINGFIIEMLICEIIKDGWILSEHC